jgi:hypothetical protein
LLWAAALVKLGVAGGMVGMLSAVRGAVLVDPVREEAIVAKRSMQLGLPLSSGGPTNPGYTTIFRPTPAPVPKQRARPRAVLTASRARWLLQFHKGPRASRHGKVQQDCMAVAWSEWVKDAAGNHMEQLTPMGVSAIAHLFPSKRKP